MMCSSPPRTSQLAILVPYRNRRRYLDIFLREVPRYLEGVNGISSYTIYVAEQQSQDLFNLALSRNVAARAALDDGASGYFVFHDVDVIPLCGVDYGPRSFNVGVVPIGWLVQGDGGGLRQGERVQPGLRGLGRRGRGVLSPPGARRRRGAATGG